jgi:hypothetical protein
MGRNFDSRIREVSIRESLEPDLGGILARKIAATAEGMHIDMSEEFSNADCPAHKSLEAALNATVNRGVQPSRLI